MGYRVTGYWYVPEVVIREIPGKRRVNGCRAGVEEVKTGKLVLRTIYGNLDPEAVNIPCTLEQDGRFVPVNFDGESLRVTLPPRRSKEF